MYDKFLYNLSAKYYKSIDEKYIVLVGMDNA